MDDTQCQRIKPQNALLLACGWPIAQAAGSIEGTVLDSTGTAVPDATLTLTDIGTNQVRTSVTSAEGYFNFPDLSPHHELFPNDAPVVFQDESLPDHGELWCQAWDCQILEQGPEQVSVRLSRYGSVTQTLMEKTITMRRDEPVLRFHHRSANVGNRELFFLWKLHPAVAIGPNHRIDVPTNKVLLEDVGPMFPTRFGGKVCEYTRPIALDSEGKQYDMRAVLPPQFQVAEMNFCVELADGWCALTDTKSKVGFGLNFPKDVFTTVWVAMLYGGWRGLYHVILAPCTAYPQDVREAVKGGRLDRLGGAQTQEADVVAVTYSNKASVSKIGVDGSVEE